MEDPTMHWRGINHLALVTTDMDATVRFYHGVLGARLVATIGTPAFRHYFFEFGPSRPPWRSSSTPTPRSSRSPSPPACPTRGPIQFDHLSFNLPDEEALLRLARPAEGARLRGHRRGRPRVHPLDLLHRPQRHRPRGVVVGARRHRPRRRLRRRALFADPDPVPAVAELRTTGELSSVPQTRLV